MNLGAAENLMAILDDKLDSIISGLHICHLALEAVVTHDSRREDHGKIFWCHLHRLAKLRLVLGRGCIPGFPCSLGPRGPDGRSRILDSLDVFVVAD
jgi:hypothetical protein